MPVHPRGARAPLLESKSQRCCLGKGALDAVGVGCASKFRPAEFGQFLPTILVKWGVDARCPMDGHLLDVVQRTCCPGCLGDFAASQ